MRWLLALTGAALIAVTGALVRSAPVTAVGSFAVLALLAVHPAVRDAGPVRRLLRAGLVLLAAAVALEHWRWPTGDPPTDPAALLALVTDPGRQRLEFLWQVGLAGCLILACFVFIVAIGQTPRDRGPFAAMSLVGGLILLSATWFAADQAWRSRPEPPRGDVFVSFGVAVGFPTGPDVEAAVGAAVLLAGAALTVLGCARRRAS
ncbi:hypothetical protein O7635_36620 [Asanoa sp. WMMD1127]|uniref:hypothetical protein n=1 Tax=Asanoa sp. WMMD1127 TaxID=3016107 RepID=UPI0024168568|nr:hypothetical protein [Asanoa sp. WMMD1127]MDG4827400.1 hypothetical protein [Asanoa sp. WMMD1127]